MERKPLKTIISHQEPFTWKFRLHEVQKFVKFFLSFLIVFIFVFTFRSSLCCPSRYVKRFCTAMHTRPSQAVVGTTNQLILYGHALHTRPSQAVVGTTNQLTLYGHAHKNQTKQRWIQLNSCFFYGHVRKAKLINCSSKNSSFSSQIICLAHVFVTFF